MQNPLLCRHHCVDRAPVRQQRHPAVKSLCHEMAGAVAAALFIGGDRQAQRDSGITLMQLGEQGHEDGQRALHVARTGAVDAPVAHL